MLKFITRWYNYVMEKLSWSALEYEEKERSADWFWALGVIVVTSSIASLIFGNYFFAALLIIAGALLGFFAVKKPDTVLYELNRKGLRIRNHLYPYENIKSFWVQTHQNEHGESHEENPANKKLKPIFFVKTERVFMPVISIPIEENFAGEIYSIMIANNVPEEKMREHPSERIIESLGL